MKYLCVMREVHHNLMPGKSRKELVVALQCVMLVIFNITINRGKKCT